MLQLVAKLVQNPTCELVASIAFSQLGDKLKHVEHSGFDVPENTVNAEHFSA